MLLCSIGISYVLPVRLSVMVRVCIDMYWLPVLILPHTGGGYFFPVLAGPGMPFRTLSTSAETAGTVIFSRSAGTPPSRSCRMIPSLSMTNKCGNDTFGFCGVIFRYDAVTCPQSNRIGVVTFIVWMYSFTSANVAGGRTTDRI